MSNVKREKLIPPGGETEVLLHSCCAPCSGEVMQAMVESGLDLTIFFYNPNIHPKKEYEIRKDENKRYADQMGIPVIDADYDVENWYARTKGLEWEPERGERCTKCFDMRFERTALFAHEHGFKVFTSSLSISRWKNMQQINECGVMAASHYDDVTYWTYNWRKNGGGERMYTISKEEHFYKQQYCGCVYSLRDTNRWRTQQGRDKVVIGEEYY
ncbi:MAG: epoxyqueuosine reductase QueH [Alphaproteobacteria bacterium]|nr:epoxyqueuosine reductase QueH [Alphaproteobacteria bacterium]